MFIKYFDLEHNKIMQFIFAISQALLVANRSMESILSLLLLMTGLAFFGLNQKKVLSGKFYFLLFLVQVICGINFYYSWSESVRFNLIAESLQVSISMLVVITASLLSFMGYWFQVRLVQCFCSQEKMNIEDTKRKSDKNNSNFCKRILLCFLCALISITICSENSFLYPINSWADSHCFFTVGKAMMNGIVPYRDLFEQKGPIMYFVYGIAWWFFKDSYLGIYFLEVFVAAVFLFYACLIVSLYKKNTENITIPLMAFLVYTSFSFRKGGSAEEICVPFIAYALYIGLASLNEQKKLTAKQFFVIGLSIGIVFWVKYTFIGFFVGWLLFFSLLYLRKNDVLTIKRMLNGIICGFSLVTLPIILYFGYHHALYDLAEVYFYDNIFVYSNYSNKSPFVALLHYGKGLCQLIKGNYPVLILICVGFFHEANRILLITFLCLFATSFFGWFSWPYTSLIFVPLSLVGFSVVLHKLSYYHESFSLKFTVPLLFAMCLLLTPNHHNIGKSKDGLPQFQFAKIIRQSENPTLLDYGFLDGGFYMAADILPNCKAFCKLNNPIKEMLQLQEKYIREGKCEFVVTRLSIKAPLYELVSKSGKYFLYRRIK